MRMVARCKEIGVDEIGCLIDYGIDSDTVLAHLQHLNRLARGPATRRRRSQRTTSPSAPQLRRWGVTHLQCTPSMARMLLTQRRGAPRARARPAPLRRWRGAAQASSRIWAPGTRASVTNMYGPTETTIWSTSAGPDPAGSAVAVGKPICNTQLYVLDEALASRSPRRGGRTLHRGRGVARGYCRRPELTAERFVPDPFSHRARARACTAPATRLRSARTAAASSSWAASTTR
ncbi:MAG: AMP-binding protein [Sandaracinaceae bacterium]|nr:AMP-binding protein [Sandaracinaceae bacterium]